MPRYFSRVVLMLGNVVTGLTILGPAGMLAELADGLHVGIHDTGLLVTYGASFFYRLAGHGLADDAHRPPRIAGRHFGDHGSR